jgi:hypothetical protein
MVGRVFMRRRPGADVRTCRDKDGRPATYRAEPDNRRADTCTVNTVARPLGIGGMEHGLIEVGSVQHLRIVV